MILVEYEARVKTASRDVLRLIVQGWTNGGRLGKQDVREPTLSGSNSGLVVADDPSSDVHQARETLSGR